MIRVIIIAWILTWFNLDNLLVTGINEIYNTNYTVALYWVFALAIGVIQRIIDETRY